MIFTETIANPAIVVLDFDKIADIAKKYGVLFAVDNTYLLSCSEGWFIHSILGCFLR